MADDKNSWTEERLEKLRTLWDTGLSISSIGEELGVTRNAIAGKAHTMTCSVKCRLSLYIICCSFEGIGKHGLSRLLSIQPHTLKR